MILEETLARPPSGDAPPDSLVWGELLSLAKVAFVSRLRSETLHQNLGHLAIVVNDAFQIHVEQSDGPTDDIDTPTYSRQRSFATLPPPVPIDTSSPGQADPKPLLDQLPELAGIDQALLKEKGFGLSALLGVLEVAWEWEITPDRPFGKTSVGAFAGHAAHQITKVTSEEFEKAIDWLTLKAEDLQAEERKYWETDRRSIRVDTRPFVELGWGLYVLPWTAMATHRIVLNYLNDGRLPWPYPPTHQKAPHRTEMYLGEAVQKALKKYRRDYCEKPLEKEECYDALSATHLKTIQNIDERRPEDYGMDSLSGQIDLLSVDPEASRIWVIEAKDPHSPFSTVRVRRSFDQFHDLDGHVDKLLRKVEDIERNATCVTSTMGIEHPNREWKVQGLMVTRHVHPAAYAVNSQVRFCTLDELADVAMGRDSNGRKP